MVINRKRTVVVIGAGGIGSHLLLKLSRLGSVNHIVGIDYDTVEYHNLNRCPFTMNSIGLNKVDAIAKRINFIGDNTYNRINKDILCSLNGAKQEDFYTKRRYTDELLFNDNLTSILANLVLINNRDIKNRELKSIKTLSTRDAGDVYPSIIMGPCTITDSGVKIYRVNPRTPESLLMYLSDINSVLSKSDYILIDASDNFLHTREDYTGGEKMKKILERVDWKLSYDGEDISFISNPYAKGEDGEYKLDPTIYNINGYREIPSNYLIPDLLCDMFINRTINMGVRENGTKMWNFPIEKVLNEIGGKYNGRKENRE